MRKRKQIWLGLSLAAAMMMGLNGCAKGTGNAAGNAGDTQQATVAETTVSDTSEAALQEKTDSSAAGDNGVREEGTRIVTDSAGREVEIPSEITKIAPSGPLAQIVLYTVSPDKLAGLAADFSDEAKQYIDEKYWGLPKFGQFYGKNASLNMEALIAEAPDVIIDIGEAKKTVKEDMDALQEQLNIPVIFVEATLPTMADAYEMLGDITGERSRPGSWRITAGQKSQRRIRMPRRLMTATKRACISAWATTASTPTPKVPSMPMSSNGSARSMQPMWKRCPAEAEAKCPLNRCCSGIRI